MKMVKGENLRSLKTEEHPKCLNTPEKYYCLRRV